MTPLLDQSYQISLIMVKRTHPLMLDMMRVHYSQPKGFVGRNICYLIFCGGHCYGGIVSGSATRHLPGRNSALPFPLNNIINNIFFHIQKPEEGYPFRNFAQKVLAVWRRQSRIDWLEKYGDEPKGFESLVELPREGTVYLRDGWKNVGTTIGHTCKRGPGKGTDSWTGRRIWDTENLRPKHVFVRDI